MSAIPGTQTAVPQPGRAAQAGAVSRRPRLANPWIYAVMIVGALVVAGLSLLFPSTPSYDPWSWLVWGREILHGQLHLIGGPTWKPLPVIFTTVFGLFGKAQPDMWLVVARAGAIVACLMSGKLAYRMTRWLATEATATATAATATTGTAGTTGAPIVPGTTAATSTAGASATALDPPLTGTLAERAAAVLPGVVAGLAAIAGLALSSNFLDSSALGYSEGLAVAALLIGVERHLDGHPRQAFVMGFLVALDRPEVWVFWGPYGLWLMWKDPGSRVLVVALAFATLALWFGPQKWGGHRWLSGVTRAQHPRANSPAFAKCPFCTEFSKDAWPKVMMRVKLAAILAILTSLGFLIAGWRAASRRAVGVSVLGFNLRAIRLTTYRQRALAVVAASGILGFAWWVLIALETQAGFSGNTRYIVIGSTFIWLCGSIAFGWAAVELARLGTRLVRRWRPSQGRHNSAATGGRTPNGAATGDMPAGAATGGTANGAARRARPQTLAATAAAAVLMALVWMFVPHWAGGSLISLSKTHKSLDFQAGLRSSLVKLIDEAGGPAKLKACGAGKTMTEGFQVPMVAWYMGVETRDIFDQPPVKKNGDDLAPGWPNNVFQDRDTGNPRQPLLPLWTTIHYWERIGAHFKVRTAPEMRFFQDCAPQPNEPHQQYTY